jgi:hypothetical protein
MINILSRIFKKIHFKYEFINLLSFFIGMFASSAMISFIIYKYYSWAIISGLLAWIGFAVLLQRHEEVIYKEITLKLLKSYDQEKVKDVIEIIHE